MEAAVAFSTQLTRAPQSDSTSPLVIWLPPSVVNGFLYCRKPLSLSLSVEPPIVERGERSERGKEKEGEKSTRISLYEW